MCWLKILLAGSPCLADYFAEYSGEGPASTASGLTSLEDALPDLTPEEHIPLETSSLGNLRQCSSQAGLLQEDLLFSRSSSTVADHAGKVY